MSIFFNKSVSRLFAEVEKSEEVIFRRTKFTAFSEEDIIIHYARLRNLIYLVFGVFACGLSGFIFVELKADVVSTAVYAILVLGIIHLMIFL